MLGGALLINQGFYLFSSIGLEHGRHIPMLVTMGNIRILLGSLAILAAVLLVWAPRLHVAWGAIVLVIGLVRVLRLEAWFANLLGAGPIIIGAIGDPLNGWLALDPMFFSSTPLFAEGVWQVMPAYLLAAAGILAAASRVVVKDSLLGPSTIGDTGPVLP